MKNNIVYILLWIVMPVLLRAQTLTCPSPLIYMDGGSFISVYNPALPLSATNPSTTTIPTFGSGLTLMPNMNGGTLSPTFYSTSAGTYWYWSGTSWVNTTHSTGNASAVNLAGCNGTLYNLVGGSGQVYSYNGTGNGSLLTTLTTFNGGGPYDLQTDCNCNFYALNTTAPNQTLTMYSASGAPLCTYSLSGMPNASAGGGFAIVGNFIYVKNNVSSPGGFYIGEILGSTVSFTSVPNFTNTPGDFASCPVCYSSATITGAYATGGLVGCSAPNTTLTAVANATGVTYNWTGPGISSGNTNSVLVASQPGTYSCVINAGGCPPIIATVTAAVVTNSNIVQAAITPSGNICLAGGSALQLLVTHTYSNDIINWSGPALGPVVNTESLTVTSAGVYSVMVIDPYTNCVGVNAVTVTLNPTVSLSSSSSSLCNSGTGGSPSSITLTPSGAAAYTLLTSPNFQSASANGTNTVLTVLSPLTFSTTGAATLIGQTGFCKANTTAIFSIYPNPTLTLSGNQYSVCPGDSRTLSVSGASSYTWTGGNGLNQNSGSTVIATPSVSSVYSIQGSTAGCRSQPQVVSVVVTPFPTLSINPTNTTICLGTSITVIASSNASSVSWNPATGLSSGFSPVVTASPPYTQFYTLSANLNNCITTGTMLIQVTQPPVVNLAMSSNSLCAYSFNGSPISLSIAATGANTYSMSASGFVSVQPGTGPVFNISPSGTQMSQLNTVTLSLIATTGVCTVSKTRTISIVPNPSIAISPLSASICPGALKGYTASGSQNYFWLPSGNYTLTGPNSISASAPMTSYYSVYGSTDGCYSDTKSSVLLISPVPTLAISKSVYTLCAGDAVPLQVIGNGTSYVWLPPVGLNPSTGSVVSASPPQTQNYTVQATLNTCTNQAVTSVSVILIPTIAATASEYTVCKGFSTQLKASGAISYLWLPSTYLNQASGNLVIAQPLANMVYTILGFNGICTASNTLAVTTLDIPNLKIAGSQPEVCEGSRAILRAGGAQFYQWSPLNSLFLSAGDSVAVAAPPASTNYSVTGINRLGTVTCASQMSYSVIVIPYAKAEASANTEICQGQKVNLYAKGGNTFSWSPSEGLTGVTGNIVLANPTITTIYNVHVSNNTSCGSDATVQVTVKPAPTVTASPDTTYKVNEVMLIRALGTGTLSWLQGEAIVCKDCFESRVYATHSGCYVVQAEGEGGCMAYDQVCLTIENDFTVYIPNTFTPNGDGLNDFFLVSGEGISQTKLAVYNRWGASVFYSEEVTKGWDGKFKGTECKQDVYTYVLSFYGLDRKFYQRTGNVQLIR